MIAKMKKVSLVCLKSERDKILTELQHSEIIMLKSPEGGAMGEDSVSGAAKRRLGTVLKELSKYSEKKKMFEELPEVEREAFDKLSNTAIDDTEKAVALLQTRDRLESEITETEASLDVLERWKSFNDDLNELGEKTYSVTLLGSIPSSRIECLKEIEGIALDILSKSEKEAVLLLSFMKEDKSEKIRALRNIGFEEASLPIRHGKIGDEIDALLKALKEKKEELDKTVGGLSDFSKKKKLDLEILFEQYRARADRSEIRLDETAEAVIVEGFIRADAEEKLRTIISGVTDIFDLEIRDPEEGEEVPTSLDNKRFVSQFEGITNMFNAPRYGDYDPNAVMAPWYWIIFGMMMGDAGYGLMMVVLIFLLKKIMKPRGGTLKLMNVLLYSSVTTIIFGVLFGSYFGEELLPAVIGFTALDDPISMLIITLVVGVLHIFTGMIVKMYIDIKNGRVLDAIFDELSWMLVISGIGMMFLPPLKSVGPVIAGVGALTVILTAGRAKKGIFGKIAGGLGGLYNVTSYFSDILSYSRILALSLATGVVGFVMNLLAGMVQGSALGFVFSLLIYALGHLFNLVLGLLSAYVHSCRLQYIEFYGKFYEGGGTLFHPFSVKTNYISIKKQ